MSYDKATVKVKVPNEGLVSDVESIARDLNKPGKFKTEKLSESYHTEGSGVDGSKVVTFEVHEYTGEIPLFTETVREEVSGSEILKVDIERGESEIAE